MSVSGGLDGNSMWAGLSMGAKQLCRWFCCRQHQWKKGKFSGASAWRVHRKKWVNSTLPDHWFLSPGKQVHFLTPQIHFIGFAFIWSKYNKHAAKSVTQKKKHFNQQTKDCSSHDFLRILNLIKLSSFYWKIILQC